MAARLASALLRAAGMVQTTHATLRSLEEAARLLLAGEAERLSLCRSRARRATTSHQPGHLLRWSCSWRTGPVDESIESPVGSVFY